MMNQPSRPELSTRNTHAFNARQTALTAKPNNTRRSRLSPDVPIKLKVTKNKEVKKSAQILRLHIYSSSNMESFTSEELKEAAEFAEFYFDLLEKHIESVPYYLSETVTLDWFGQTVRGQKNVGIFLKNHASSMKHLFDNPRPTRKIGHRDTHVIRCPRELRKRHFALKTPSVVTVNTATEVDKTPPNAASSSHHLIERGQGDGVHNYSELPPSPAKRSRLAGDLIPVASPEDEIVCSPVKFLSSVGHVEFRRRSLKKMQLETKWSRPCKLEIGYSSTTIKDSTIHLIIYASNMKCRRNLLKEFESLDANDDLNPLK